MSTPIALAIGPGSLLGRYQVLSHLASGGMAEIYLARATGLQGFERFVVVKCIKPEHARDQRFVAMFIDEARLSAQLHHTNIAQVYDIGQESGAYYFAMEYVHGENVREFVHKVALQRRVVPVEHALTIIAGAAAGLHYAHDKRGNDRTPLNIVHRDVSPSNIIVAYDGGVKVVDFGIAKAAARMTETQSGTLKGKVAYMSPEQCSGRPIDRRSDVFALGIVLYELTTMTRLFTGESEYLTMNKIVTGDFEPPSARRADYPRELETIILNALALSPDDRTPTVAAMLDQIIAFTQREKITMSTVGLERYLRDVFGERPEPWLEPIGLGSGAVSVGNLPPARPNLGEALSKMTATGTAGPSGLTSGIAAHAAAPNSQASLLLSAEIKSIPEPRSRRTLLWLGSALLFGAALIGGAMVFDARREREEFPAQGDRPGSELGRGLAPVTAADRPMTGQPIDAGIPSSGANVDAAPSEPSDPSNHRPLADDRKVPPRRPRDNLSTTPRDASIPAGPPPVPIAPPPPPLDSGVGTTPRSRDDLRPPRD